MANVDYFGNKLKGLLDDPNSFSGTPGFQFALNQGLGSIQRQNSAQRGSGNVLAALTKYGTGLATQDYGNQVSRLGSLLGQEQGYDLGQRNAALGEGRLGLDSELGRGRLTLDNRKADQDFGFNMYKEGNDFQLGSEANANTAQNNWYGYDLGKERNATANAGMENDYNLGWGKNAIDWMNAGTNRGSAESNAYLKWLEMMKNGGGASAGGY